MEQKKKKNRSLWPLWVLAIALIVVPGAWLAQIFWGYHTADAAYSAVAEEATSPVQVTAEDGENYELLQIDWDALRAQNPEVVGWLQVDALPQISYPIVRAENDSYYLDHSFACVSSKSGAIFMETQNAGDFSDLYTIIYGHNMKNGSMFGGLKKFANADFCAQNSHTVTLYTPDGIWRYEIFSAEYAQPDAAGVYTIGYAAGADYLAYLNDMTARSLYDFGMQPSDSAPVLTLSTCSGDEMRFVIHAQRTQQLVLQEQNG